MPTVPKDYKWGVLGHSQLGASHVRQGLPNQDAIRYYNLPDGSCPVVVAVADGHGSAKSFRSHVGAAIAAETAVQVCLEFLEGTGDAPPSAVKNAAEQHIPARIFQAWKRRVAEHHARNPFTTEELNRLAEQSGAADRDRMARAERPQLAYGSTLLTAFLTNEYLMAFQLGDGDILAVSDSTGEVGYVIPKDESLIANETTSLCQDDAHKYVRCRFQLFQGRPPGLVMLSTDGYANSFATAPDFLKAGTDYLDMLQSEGKNSLQKNLPEWLEEASRQGSGDDITLGMIYRITPPFATHTTETQSDVTCSDESKTPPTGVFAANESSVPAPSGDSGSSTLERATAESQIFPLTAPQSSHSSSHLTAAPAQNPILTERPIGQGDCGSALSQGAPSIGSVSESGALGSSLPSAFEDVGLSRERLPLKDRQSDAPFCEVEPFQEVIPETPHDAPSLTDSRIEPKPTESADDAACSSHVGACAQLDKAALPDRSTWKDFLRVITRSKK